MVEEEDDDNDDSSEQQTCPIPSPLHCFCFCFCSWSRHSAGRMGCGVEDELLFPMAGLSIGVVVLGILVRVRNLKEGMPVVEGRNCPIAGEQRQEWNWKDGADTSRCPYRGSISRAWNLVEFSASCSGCASGKQQL